MSDTVELWSSPWHTLQRRLANGVGTDGTVAAAACAAGAPRRVGPRISTPASGHWLNRIRKAAPPVAAARRR